MESAPLVQGLRRGVVLLGVDEQRSRSVTARPEQRCGDEGNADALTLGPGGYGQALEVSDPKADSGDGETGEARFVSDRIDDMAGGGGETFPQARSTHPPSNRKSLSIEEVQFFQRSPPLDLVTGTRQFSEVVLKEQERLGDLVARLPPKLAAVSKNGRREDGLGPIADHRSDFGEKLGTAPLEPQRRGGDVIVPWSGMGTTPSVRQEHGLRPASSGPVRGGGHVWESMGVEVVYLSHDVFYKHYAGARHIERPDRLRAVEEGVERSGLEIQAAVPAPADREALSMVHDPRYVDALREFCLSGGGSIDSDTHAVADTWEASIRAAGSGLSAIPLLAGGGVAMAAVRPPGHHATANRAMGFCFLNNVAVAAAHLRSQGRRVAVVDWDVHHGNGTQEMFQGDGDVLYVSIHQSPFYPLTGYIEDIQEAEGTIINLPVPVGTGGDLYRRAFAELIEPIVTQFQPDWLLISAGYDAHEADPLGGLRLDASDYGHMSARLRAILPDVPTIVFLEGGYDLEALASGVDATLRGLTGVDQFSKKTEDSSPEFAYRSLEVAKDFAAAFWSL